MSDETREDNQLKIGVSAQLVRFIAGFSCSKFAREYQASRVGQRLPIWLFMLLCVALFLRSFALDWKPPHFDEGINGHFVHEMWRVGYYKYDPTNFHGPLYFYFLQMIQLLFGDGIVAARFGTGLLSVAIVFVIAQLRQFVGRAAVWAAVIVTFSAGFVFYARYSIHESMFILLQVIFVYGYYLWQEQRSRFAFTLMTIGIFGAFATKETFFIFFVTWAIALSMSRIDRFFPIQAEELKAEELKAEEPKARSQSPAEREDQIAIVLVVSMATLMLFTGFFMNDDGLVDMFRAYGFWTRTGVTGTGHEKFFGYWITLLWKYEWPLLIALGLTPLVFFRGAKNERQWALVAFGTWLAYSLIPYKTPWCVLDILWPLAMVVGFLIERGPRKVVGSILIAATLVSGVAMLRVNFKTYDTPSEPYVYVQSSEEFKAVMDLIYNERNRVPESLNMRVMVLNRDSWPMPWIFQDYPHLEYGKIDAVDPVGADVILFDAQDRPKLEAKLTGKYWAMPFQIRDSYEKGFAFLNFERFQNVVPAGSATYDHPSLPIPKIEKAIKTIKTIKRGG